MTGEHVPKTSRRLTVNGLRLHYLEWGNPKGRPIVCLHGFTGSARDFGALARLQDGYRVIAVDLRGHGESAWSPSGAYEYADYVDDLAAFVKELNLAPFTLIGTGMGGVTAMAYAAAYPQCLDAMVVNDVGPEEESGSAGIVRWVDKRPQTFSSLADALAYCREAVPTLTTRSEEDQLEVVRGVLNQAARGRWVWRLDPAATQQRAERGPLKRPELWPALAALPCPVLVVWAMESRVLSEAQARRMVETLPCGELAPVPDRGHAPTLAEPAALTAIQDLLGRLPQ